MADETVRRERLATLLDELAVEEGIHPTLVERRPGGPAFQFAARAPPSCMNRRS